MVRLASALLVCMGLGFAGCDGTESGRTGGRSGGTDQAVAGEGERAVKPLPTGREGGQPVDAEATARGLEGENVGAEAGGAERAAATKPAQPEAGIPDRLLGTWTAQDVDADLGQVDIKLTFRQEGNLRLLAWSDIPLVGQVKNKSAPYQVKGNVISSEAIRGGTSVEFRFNDVGQLVIEYTDGKTVVFKAAEK